jgi:hypothetical protein
MFIACHSIGEIVEDSKNRGNKYDVAGDDSPGGLILA